MPSFWRKVRGQVIINDVGDDQEEMVGNVPFKNRRSFKKEKKEEEVEAKALEPPAEEKNKDQKSGPTVCDSILWDPWIRLLYVLLLCAFLGLVIPYLLSTLVFQHHVEPFPHRGFCQIVTENRYPCLPGKFVSESTCRSASCCYDIRSHGDMMSPICYHSTPSDYGYTVADLYRDNTSSSFSFRHLDLSENRPRRPILPSRSSFTPPTRIWRLQDSSSLRLTLISLRSETPWGKPTSPLHLLAECVSDDIVRIKLWSVDQDHVEETEQSTGQSAKKCQLDVIISEKPGSNFNITVNRTDTAEVIFDTSLGPMIYGEDYWEITTQLPTRHFYGMGPRHSLSISPDFDAREHWAIHNTQDPAQKDQQSSSHPFYMCFEPTNKIHGVLLQSTSSLDVTVLPEPSLILRGLTGPIELMVMAGPTPQDVSRQYASVTGFPAMPPLWALGYHLCRSSGSLSHFMNVTEEMNSKKIPYESDCVDALLRKKDPFAPLQEEVKNLIVQLKEKNRKFLMVSYPTVPETSNEFETAKKQDLLLKTNESQTLYGIIDKTTVAFPDYSNENITEWLESSTNFNEIMSIVDGLILQDNTPLNEAYTDAVGNCTSRPEACCEEPELSYLPVGFTSLSNGTACMGSLDTGTPPELHMNHHNEYGHLHTVRMNELLQSKSPGTRTFVTSLSTSSGSGAYGGQFGGDFPASFLSARRGLIHILQLGLAGVPLVSDPICGNRNASIGDSVLREVCMRGHQTAAFYPFMISYNDPGHLPRNPVDLDNTFAEVIRLYIMQRYMLLPYVYTNFFEASETGSPVIRPLFYEFPKDNRSRDVSTQFMLGSGLLISPAFGYLGLSNRVDVNAYFPPGCWYSMYNGDLIVNSDGEFLVLPTVLTDTNVHARGGHIIAMQGNLHEEDISNSVELRKKNFILLVALSCVPPDNNSSTTTTTTVSTAGDDSSSSTPAPPMMQAKGHIIIDDGVSLLPTMYTRLDFEATNHSLIITKTVDDYLCSDEASALNLSSTVEKVWVFGVPPVTDVTVIPENKSIPTHHRSMNALNLDLCNSPSYRIEW